MYSSSDIQDMKKAKIFANNLFYLLQVAIAKKWRLSELIMKKNCGTQIITCVTELIQISSLRTNYIASRQAGLTRLLLHNL